MTDKNTILTKEILAPVIDHWKSVLGLSGWDLSIAVCDELSMNSRIREFDKDALDEDTVLGCVTHCYPVEQVATVQFRKDAPKFFGQWVNLDTLVCHELIHVLVRSEFDRLPKASQKSKKLGELEEFICDKFSYILFKVSNTQNHRNEEK